MYAAVRVRGQPDVRKRIRENLDHLGLTQKNHCVLLPEEDTFRGMLVKSKDFITFGTIDSELAVELLESRGETDHGQLSDSLDELEFDTVEDLVEAYERGDVSLSELRERGFRNCVRLTPPSKGFKDTKQHYNQGGSLGDRGEAIEELLNRMF